MLLQFLDDLLSQAILNPQVQAIAKHLHVLHAVKLLGKPPQDG